MIDACDAATKAPPTSTLVSDTAASAVWTLASRLTGFARVVLIGAVLGPTYFGNLFQLANQLPWVVFELAIGSLLYALLIPELVTAVADGDLESVERIASGFLGVVMMGFSALAVVVAVAAPLIARLFALPLSSTASEADFLRAALPLVVLTTPQLVGYGMAMTGQAVQQAMGRFALPAAAAIVENTVLIAALGVFALRYGTGVPLNEIRAEHLVLLGGGASLGVFLHAVVQFWGVRRLGIRLRLRPGWSDPAVARILRTAVPSSGTAVLNSVRLLVLMVSANVVPGGVVAFQLALNVLNLPVALGAKPVAYASLPRLSLLHKRGQRAEASRSYGESIAFAGLFLIPAAAAVAAIGRLVAGGLALGEMATDDGRRLVALCLLGVGGAVLGEGLFQITTSASYAFDDPIGPLRGLAVRLCLTLMGMAGAALTLEGPLLLFGFLLAMSAGDVISALLLHRRIAGRLRTRLSTVTPIGPVLVSTAVVYGAAAVAVELLLRSELAPLSQPASFLAAAIVFLATSAVFALMVQWSDPQVPGLLADIRHRQRRSAS